MKPLIILIAIVFFGVVPSYAQPTVAISEASAFVGQQVKICDSVIHSNALEVTDVKPTILIIGGSDPASQLAIVIKAENRKWFDYKPEKDLLNRKVCVTGMLENVKGRLQIQVEKQELIDLVKN